MMTASALALESSLPEPTVAKVLKLLARQNIVLSIRGVNGGYKLASAPSQINIGDVIAAVDGPIALTACVDSSAECCSIESTCQIKGRWNPINAAIQDSLGKITLADMAA